MFLGIEYSTWWFLVVGGLFSGYAILDGFDLGAGAWHLFFRKEESRRIALNAIGPVWDGNEVWLVIGGGTLFAGFPEVYATLFSAMYIPFMLFLLFLIFRAISIEFRSKEPMRWWRQMWDVSYSISSIMLAVLLGVVLGNVLLGMPLDEQFVFRGHWLSFINVFSLLTGLTSLALFMLHGALYLLLKTEGRLFAKLTILIKGAIRFFGLTFALTTIYALVFIPHLSDDFLADPELFVLPALAFGTIALIPRLVRKRRYRRAFLASSAVCAMLLMLAAVEIYPVILRSTVDTATNSLTVTNSAASTKSLGIMLTMALIGAPLVLSYTAFVFYTFRGKVRLDENSY